MKSRSDPEDPIARAVANFKAGIDRESSFRILHDRFHRPVRSFFARRVPVEDCFDLTQETFFGLYRGLDGFREEAKLATWLFRIAHNVLLRWRRNRRARADVRQQPSAPSNDELAFDDHQPIAVDRERTPEEQVLYENLRQRLCEAIEELPEKMQECLRLRIYNELPYKEIAEILGISIETVKAHLFQARKKLKAKLGDSFDGFDF